MHTSIRSFFAVAIATLSFATPRAEAAPQILGLVASNGLPVPMRCEAGDCTALLASFCLQEARDAPEDGRTGIDDHFIFKNRMPRRPLLQRPAFVLRKALGTQRDGLIEPDALADGRGFADESANGD